LRDTPLILVADDDADHREILAWRLETRGYAVVLAADGVEALATARERRPDLVLMDASMPGSTASRCAAG
jgi:CheY-like chemotaxis protein